MFFFESWKLRGGNFHNLRCMYNKILMLRISSSSRLGSPTKRDLGYVYILSLYIHFFQGDKLYLEYFNLYLDSFTSLKFFSKSLRYFPHVFFFPEDLFKEKLTQQTHEILVPPKNCSPCVRPFGPCLSSTSE